MTCKPSRKISKTQIMINRTTDQYTCSCHACSTQSFPKDAIFLQIQSENMLLIATTFSASNITNLGPNCPKMDSQCSPNIHPKSIQCRSGPPRWRMSCSCGSELTIMVTHVIKFSLQAIKLIISETQIYQYRSQWHPTSHTANQQP